MEASSKANDKEKFKKLLDEMEWLDEDKLAVEDKVFTSQLEMVKYKMMKNPFVPIGCLATMTVLGMGIRNFIKGGPTKTSQYFMRWRVGLQAATIGALLIGVTYEQYLKYK